MNLTGERDFAALESVISQARRRHSDPSPGLRASDRPGSSPRGETAPAPRTRPQTGPRVPARSPPRARPWASGRFGNRERRTGRKGAGDTPELGRGDQGSDVRAPGPLSSRGPEREAPGLGITDGAARKESPGAPGSAALLFLKCFLISAVRTASAVLPRCCYHAVLLC